MKPSRHIPTALRHEICSMPCVICGGTFNVCADHIIPYSKGGTSHPTNLQPLCWQCNAKKRNRFNNAELLTWFLANKTEHLLRAKYHEEFQYTNRTEWLSYNIWKRQQPHA